MKRFLLKIWRILPGWLQRIASAILRPHFQVDVVGVIFNQQGQILLCRHTYRRLHPWGLPGGDIKFGEDPDHAVRREVREETGLRVQATRLLRIESSRDIRKLVLTYLCTGVSGTFHPNEEVSMIQYYDLNSLPPFPAEQYASLQKVLAILQTEGK